MENWMDINTLKTFLTLVEVGSFTRTSEKLYVSQSTVTNRIADLENEVGKRLLNRGQKQIELTKEGMLFLEYAKRMVELEQKSLESLNRVSKYESMVQIGATNTIYESYLEREIISYHNQKPKTAIKVILGHSEELLLKLQDKILDIAYTYIPLYKNDISCEVYHKDKLVLVTAYGNDKYKDGINRDDLLYIEYLMCNFKLQGIGEFLSEIFPAYQQFSFEIDNSVKMIPFLLAGEGYSFLPENIVEIYVMERKLRMIPLIEFETPEIISYCVKRR